MRSAVILLVGLLCTCTFANPMPVSIKLTPIESNAGKPELNLSKEVNDMAKQLMSYAMKMEVSLYSEPGNANEFIDKLLINMREYIKENNYDPLELEEKSYCKSIYAQGLSTVKRAGDSTISYNNNRVIIQAYLGFSAVKVKCDLEYQLWWQFWLSGMADADIRDIKMRGTLQVETNEDMKAKLTDFAVTSWGNMKVHWSGSNWIGKIVEFFNNMFPSIVTNQLKKRVPDIVKNSINDLLDSFSFESIIRDSLLDG